jgi:hypothetical protein
MQNEEDQLPKATRKTKYSYDEREKVLERLFMHLSKGKSILHCTRFKWMPDRTVIYRWLEENDKDTVDEALWKETMRNNYKVARSNRAEHIFEEIIKIADGQKPIKVKEEKTYQNENPTQRDNLRIRARQWHLSKMDPHLYGERVTTNHEGEINTNNANIDLSGLTEEELDFYIKLHDKLDKQRQAKGGEV